MSGAGNPPRRVVKALEEASRRIQQGDLKAAHKLLRKCHEVSPQYFPLVLNYANVCADMGLTKDAGRLYLEALKLEPKSFEAHANFAIFLLENPSPELPNASPSNEAAIQHFKQAVTLSPCWFDGHYNLGNLLSAAGVEGEALHHYAEATKIAPDSFEAHLNLGACLQTAGRLLEAARASQRAVQLNKESAEAWHNLASCLHQQGKAEEALPCARKAAELRPSFTDGLLQVALLYRSLGDYEQAIKYLQQALDTSSDAWSKLKLRLRLSFLHREAGQEEEAQMVMTPLLGSESSLISAAAASPSAVPYDVACCAVLAGDPRRALETIEKAPTVGGEGGVSQVGLQIMNMATVHGLHRLTHKCELARMLKCSGLEELAPPSFIVKSKDAIEEAITKYEVQDSSPTVWFLKDPLVQRGQGVRIFKAVVELSDLPPGKEYCLQPSVPRLLLIDGVKFGLRLHALLLGQQKGNLSPDLSLFVFREAVLTKSAEHFSVDSTSLQVHITCTSVQRSSPSFQREKVKGPASRMLPQYEEVIFPRIGEAIAAAVGAVRADLKLGMSLEFQILGVDVLVDSDYQVYLLEFNAAPQFGDPQNMVELREKLALPMLNSLPELLSREMNGEAIEVLAGWQRVSLPSGKQ